MQTAREYAHTVRDLGAAEWTSIFAMTLISNYLDRTELETRNENAKHHSCVSHLRPSALWKDKTHF